MGGTHLSAACGNDVRTRLETLTSASRIAPAPVVEAGRDSRMGCGSVRLGSSGRGRCRSARDAPIGWVRRWGMRAARTAAGARTAFPPWRYIGLVLLGGTVGTGLREAITLLTPRVADVPVATVGINVVGAFLLGVLLEHLARSGPDAGRRQDLRLLLGAGGLGGFTTYSALATDTVL